MTHAGCGAICPTYDRGCYGCYGPKELVNTASLGSWAREELAASGPEVRRLFHNFNAWSEPFREEGEAHG